MFPKEFTDYGVCTLDEADRGVRVYYTQSNYQMLYQPDVVEAYWTGGCNAIITKLKDGRTLRWTGLSEYATMR